MEGGATRQTTQPLTDFANQFKKHSRAIRGLVKDPQLAALYTGFYNQSVGSTERGLAFQTLKTALTSKTNSKLDARTTLLDNSGVVIADDIDDHKNEACASCHGPIGDTDVIVAKLRSAGVSLNTKSPIVTVTLEQPKKQDKQDPEAIANQKIIKALEKTINININQNWIITIESNLYAKFYSLLPQNHPKLPVRKYVCFTKEIDQNIRGEPFIIKSFIGLLPGLNIDIKY